MLRVCVVFITFVVFSSIIHAAPKFKSDIKSCYKEPCPEDTFACEKISKISFDRKNILHEIHCLGLKDDVLKNVTSSEPNSFGPRIIFASYQYSGNYEIIHTNTDSDVTPSPAKKNKDFEEIEFNHIGKGIPKTGNHGFSEVDDLNGEAEVIH
ncbi:uncharacterized protein [Diabrotica undecimpunctata]|uniref:uncharacterized protein isoform X1 n=1 Tax=Diabrotica undecimpunctata TaxID=50387 RepID=UPI003B64062C